MKKLALIVVALCTFAPSCNHEDTENASVGRRTMEARLTGEHQWQRCARQPLRGKRVVEMAVCGTSPASGRDEAVSALERRATQGSTTVWSDLAAMYYDRAQRKDQPLDLLRALDAAQRATAQKSASKEALFNRALAEEALSLHVNALASWNEYVEAESDPEWKAEAREHIDRLRRLMAYDAAAQWELTRARLEKAVRAKDSATVDALLQPFPGSAQSYFEENVFALWTTDPAAARLLAGALSRRFQGDPYDIEVVKALDAAAGSPERLTALREGHENFRQARIEERTFKRENAAFSYAAAAERLGHGGSPLHLHARLGHALTAAPDVLLETENAARAGQYTSLLARLLATRASLSTNEGRHLQALAESEEALAEYLEARDHQGAASLQSRRIGYIRIIGQREAAWRVAVAGMRTSNQFVDLRNRHFILGETADTAEALGYPRIAASYRGEILRIVRQWQMNTRPDDILRQENIRHQHRIALVKHAGTAVGLGDHATAQRDLVEAERLLEGAPPDSLLALRSRMRQLEGEMLLPERPLQAVAAFTRAIESAPADELPIFLARIYVQRANAYKLLGRHAESTQDYLAAINHVREEEKAALAGRQPGEFEEFWSPYFSRTREIYELLIQHYAEQGLVEDAFLHAERARAVEPLHLLLQRGVAPRRFRELTAGGESVALADLQKHLPAGTFLIQYSVQRDRSYVWVISRDRFVQLPQPYDASEVARWTDAVQSALQDEATFDAAITAPYKPLLEGPLMAVARMPGGLDPNRRLVIIPDGALHGLPFAALKDEKTNDHLLENATVEIAGSATLYLFSLMRKAELHSTPAPSALLIGNPTVESRFVHTYQLRDLSGAVREVKQLKDVYGPGAQVRLGDDATVRDFFAQAPRHTVIHIAAHAVANPAEPSASTVFLSSTPEHPGAIDAKELLKRLQPGRTKLVVLAACRSAGGVPVGPEGVAPLVRPFLTSGVPSVVGSLWDVNDATVTDLLVSFHRDYEQHGDAAMALRRAQRELLPSSRNAGRKPAIVWAGFQVIGH